jgi:hypothetical protein
VQVHVGDRHRWLREGRDRRRKAGGDQEPDQRAGRGGR